MEIGICSAVLILGLAQSGRTQTNTGSTADIVDKTAPELATSPLAIIGATPDQEALLRSQIQIMNPTVVPLRIVCVPHWKYIDTARTFQLHVPKGFGSLMFTHLPSRTVFIDIDRYLGPDWLGYWMAHELGHLATNSAKESDAENAAHEFRRRLKDPRNKHLL